MCLALSKNTNGKLRCLVSKTMARVDARPKGKDPPRAHPEHAEGVDLLWPVQECLGIPH